MNKMPRTAAAILLAGLLPTLALAQVTPATPKAASAPTSPAPPAAPATATPAPHDTIVVEGRRPLPTEVCKPNDQACIKTVVTALWERYPKQMEIFCTNEHTRKMRDMNLAQQLGYTAGQLAGSDVDDHGPPIREQMCPFKSPKPRAP